MQNERMPRNTSYRLVDIYHGKQAGREGYLYATLTADGVPIIHATLDYILERVKENGYVLVGDK